MTTQPKPNSKRDAAMGTTEKPRALAPMVENVPAELKERPQWVAGAFQWKEETHEWAKIPHDAKTREWAKSNDPSTWSTFADALRCYQHAPKYFSGIGYEFSTDDPYCGVDLDDCITETGELEAWAADIVPEFATYTEVSPSGKGLKLFAKGKLPGGGTNKPNGYKVEMYDCGRFFTVTGHHLDSTPTTIEERQDAVTKLYTKIKTTTPNGAAAASSASSAPPSDPRDLDDDALLERARKAKNGDKFRLLFDYGDIAAYNNDHSAADLALCCMLAYWTGKDAARMDRLFRRSALNRSKWDEKHSGDGRTYGQMTIERARATVRETYESRDGSGAAQTAARKRESAAVPEWTPDAQPTSGAAAMTDSDDDDAKPKRRNAADRLIGYALADPTQTLLFVDQHGQPHALVNGQPVPLTSRCHSWLRRLMWQHEERTASGEALSQAAGTLAALAEDSGNVRELHVRSAWRDGALFVELDAARVLRVDADGWQLDAKPPVMFRRFVNLKPLPTPERGGPLDTLLDLLPLRSERDRRLLIAYVTCGLLDVPRPILLTTGEMGSGKTTLHRIVKRLIDPTTPETIRLDRDDALQKVAHCAVVLCDNLSQIRDWQTDLLCRFVTGEGDSKRVLYTDDDDFIVELKRLILLNAINAPADRPDFIDRCLCLELERIPDNERREEAELWAVFNREHPKWLGCIFNLLSRAMAIRPTLRLSRLPRLADWGRWAAAVYEAAGWGAATFQTDWSANVKTQQAAVLEGSTLAQVVLSFMDGREEWTGTPTDLLAELKAEAERLKVDAKRDRVFPQTPRWLWRRLKEVKQTLTAHGIEASQGRGYDRRITFRKVCKNDDGVDGVDETLEKPPVSAVNTPDDIPHNDGVDGDDDGKKAQKIGVPVNTDITDIIFQPSSAGARDDEEVF